MVGLFGPVAPEAWFDPATDGTADIPTIAGSGRSVQGEQVRAGSMSDGIAPQQRDGAHAGTLSASRRFGASLVEDVLGDSGQTPPRRGVI